MIFVAATAIVLWLARLGGSILLLIPMALILGGMGWLAWWWNRGRRARPGLSIVLVSVAASLVTGYLCTEPLKLIGFALGWLVALLVTPILIGAGVAWWQAGRRSGDKVGLPGWMLLILVSLPLSMPATRWPFHLAFNMVRPELIRLAAQVAAGKPVALPRQVGIYTIVAVHLDPDHPASCALLLDINPNGPTGFVRWTGDTNPKPTLKIVPSDYAICLGKGWAFWSEE